MCQPKKCLIFVYFWLYGVKHSELEVVSGLVKAYIYTQHAPTYTPTIAWCTVLTVHPVQKLLLFFGCMIGDFCCNNPAPVCVAKFSGSPVFKLCVHLGTSQSHCCTWSKQSMFSCQTRVWSCFSF